MAANKPFQLRLAPYFYYIEPAVPESISPGVRIPARSGGKHNHRKRYALGRSPGWRQASFARLDVTQGRLWDHRGAGCLVLEPASRAGPRSRARDLPFAARQQESKSRFFGQRDRAAPRSEYEFGPRRRQSGLNAGRAPGKVAPGIPPAGVRVVTLGPQKASWWP
jgi:hypothetical protein